jgi:hypothetical protein
VLAVWILLAVLASLLALLAVPLDLAFSLQRREGRQEASGTLRWLFGLVRVRLRRPRRRARGAPERTGAKRGRRQGRGARRMMAMLRIDGFRTRLLRLARDLLRRIRVRDLSLRVRLGLDDPADTGRLWGVVGPLAAILPWPRDARVAVEPDFGGEALEIDGRGDIRVVPLQLLWAILVFALSPVTLRALRTARAEAP